MKVWIVDSEYHYDDDHNWDHRTDAVFSTLEAAQQWVAANDPGDYRHFDISGVEVDQPDTSWELHTDPRCEVRL